MKFHAILLFLLILCHNSFSQNKSQNNQPANLIKGVVLDEENMPVIGANVIVLEKNAGTITDIEGKFKINAPVKSVVQISFIGYKSKEITIKDKNDLNIIMELDTKLMDEVVVVGYGTQKKVNLTGSISSISATEMEKTASVDAVNTLTGRVPGVRVAQYSSEPGTFDTNIDIRGFGTPLYIIDGVERSKEEFSRLSSYEIDNVSILKDASAAIYGVKAANGVVLITTRTGNKAKTKVSYNGRYGSVNITSFPEKCNAAQYAELWNEKTMNAGIILPDYFTRMADLMATLKYSAETIEKYKSGELPSTNYLGLIFKNQAFQQQHSISIDGGTDATQFFVTMGYYKEEGLYTSNDLSSEKYNLRLNLSNQLSKSLKFNVNIGYINTLKDSPYRDLISIFKPTISALPMEGPYANNNSNYLSSFTNSYENPLALIEKDISGFQKNDEKFLQSNFELIWNIPYVKGLIARSRFSYDYINRFSKAFRKPYQLYKYDAATDEYNGVNYNTPANVSEITGQNIRKNTQLSLNYNKKINNKHNIAALLLYEQIRLDVISSEASTDVKVDLIPDLSSGIKSTNSVGSSFAGTSKRSFVGRLNYDYMGKYLLEVSGRYDGSSKYPVNNRWGLFPAASAGWRVSEESFIKKNMSFVDNFKIRASWGKLGDDAAADNQFQSGYYYPSTGYMFGSEWVSGYDIQNLANPNLTWYTSQMTNVGFDLSFWKSKFTMSVDYFARTREGLLAYRNLSIPNYFGATLPQENLNGDKTSGFELVLGHKNKIGKLTYGIEGNVTFTRTMNEYIEETPARDSYTAWKTTKSYRYADVVWGYKTDGVYKTFAEIANGPIMDINGNRTVLPGDYKFVDENGDGYIDDKDKRPIGIGGNNKPLLYFGLNFNLAFKGFDFSMLWQGAALNTVRYLDMQFITPLAWNYANPMVQWYDRWKCINYDDPYNDASWIPGKYPSTGERKSNSGDWLNNDRTFFDARYIRLKNIELGYTIPQKITKKFFISKCRIYLNAFNPVTIQNGYGFLDPEANSGRYYSYPVTFSMNSGINLTF
jgi:TonB-linked SusC/RagA family outer membrane protein